MEDLKIYYSLLCNIKMENLIEIFRDEYDIDGFLFEVIFMRDYVLNEGFWIDRVRGSWDQWIGVGVELGYDEIVISGIEFCYYENKDFWREVVLKIYGLMLCYFVK